MKLSRNNIIVSKNNDSFIVANTLTRYVVELNSEALADVKNGDVNNLNDLTKEQFNKIIKMGFLVPNNLNEKKFLDHILRKERLNERVLSAHLMCSTACNFDCQYCYEKGQVNCSHMSNKIKDNILVWYEYKFRHGNFKRCQVILYGGEPLLYSRFFDDFLRDLQKIAKKCGISIDTKMFTNGYLLTDKIFNLYKKYDLREVNVTIDGPKKIHNKLRPLKGNAKRGTFSRILNNLVSASSSYPNVVLNCRISFNKTNLKQIPELLDIIKERDKAGNIKPYFAHITQTSSQATQKRSFCSQNVFSDDEELADNYIFLYKEAKKRGFEIPTFVTLGPCMFYAENNFLISPEGDLYKCLDMVGINDLSVGNVVDSLIYYKTNYYDMIKADKINNCLKTNCPVIPICGTGCAMESLIRCGNYDKITCRRKMLEKNPQFTSA